MYERVLWFFLGAILFVFAAIIFMSLFMPQAEATTTMTKYTGLNTSPLQPLVFIQDSYGNIHVSSADTFVWRVLRCMAPASGYDAYLSTGILQSHGLRISENTSPYKSTTWYTEDIDFATGLGTGDVVNPQVLRASELTAFVRFVKSPNVPVPPPELWAGGNSPIRISVYYLPTADTKPTLQYRDFSTIVSYDDISDSENFYLLDLDESLLATRGFLNIEFNFTRAYRGGTIVGEMPSPDSRYFLYGNVPGGQTGYQTVEHAASTYISGSQDPVTVHGKLGDVVMGYNLGSQTPQLSLVGRSQLDIFRTTHTGPLDPFLTYRPAVYAPFTPYWHEGSTGIGIQTITIPYYRLYDDPENDSTQYQITCTISNPWGSEDLFPHRFT